MAESTIKQNVSYNSFDLEGVTIGAQISFSSSEKKQLTATFTKEGYYPVCLSGFRSSSQFASVLSIRLTGRSEGTATVEMEVRNLSSSTASMSLYTYILWMKI